MENSRRKPAILGVGQPIVNVRGRARPTNMSVRGWWEALAQPASGTGKVIGHAVALRF